MASSTGGMHLSPPSSSPTSPVESSSTPKQLHPSAAQYAAEAEQGIDNASLSQTLASTTSTPSTLAAPKPVVIETRAGPISPKVSPRLLGRTLGDRSANRSPAYSANSSPRGSLRGLPTLSGLNSPLATEDTVPENRRSSGNLTSSLAHLSVVGGEWSSSGGNAAASSGKSLSNSNSAASLTIPSPMVRRASKPMILHNGTNAQLQALLSKHTVADLHTARSVIELASTASPAEGFELLLQNQILSCPVYDATKKEYIGFLDVRDLVSSIVFAHEEQKLTSSFHDRWSELMLAGLQRLGAAVSVSYLARRNPFRPVAPTATLLQVARALSAQLHRVPVIDAEGKCVSILSQSSLVQFLHAHRDEIKQDLGQTIAQLGLGLCKVISVTSDSSAWQAFKVLEVNSVSGIAIIDRDGKLVGNTSARDLKHFVMNKGNLSLDVPIQEYLAKLRQRDYIDEVHPSCSIGINTSVAHCVGLMSATGYHRVFIVDSQGRPIGVVSVTDILRFAAAEASSGGNTASASPSQPTTPRGSALSQRRQAAAVAGDSPASVASPVAPSPKSVGGAPTTTTLRAHSQSASPIITPTSS